ncbi:DUF2922 domain-containing protein [Eubacterium sp. 1001713B170207_170306_E7]|uniref:DUF2922 domain-containing protein n=1 Tax=Eubacterium sp. 1001713B170207_170306_E7 TaxID=2787097 RepID=UPI00189ADD00|nr:DUF2922 domain-containing protein [Eubacterium sp. 1001713B170207_170306_E7]
MAEKTSKELIVTYERADGKNFNLTIPDLREDITDAEINTGVKAILTQDIFAPEGFGLSAVAGARKVETKTTDIPIEEA